MSKLAIVIPAYKVNYFDQTLASIANQTCKDFTLYIGDDASPANLAEIVNAYKKQINIVYKRFDKNLGGADLVAHWERCIDLVQDEEWIWLFSDDDTMENKCVEMFYASIDQTPDFNVFHFNVLQIDIAGNVTGSFQVFPETISSEEFLINKLQRPYQFSVVVEYIFKKEYFMRVGRFVKFDLAWGSDDATWIKLAKKNGIKTINGAMVHWRESPYNISPNISDSKILTRKYYSQIAFGKWATDQVLSSNLQIDIDWLHQQIANSFLTGIKEQIDFLSLKIIKQLLIVFDETFANTIVVKSKLVKFSHAKVLRVPVKIAKTILNALGIRRN
jgi:glycosyltransferase involved in cell wall biosynthesis